MRVVGIDMSLTGTGVSDGFNSWLHSSAPAGQALSARQARIHELAQRIVGQVDVSRPLDLVVVELPVFGGASGRGAMVLERSGLYWRVVDTLSYLDVPVVEVVTSTLKRYATGNGAAGKGLMIDAAARRLPDVPTGADDNRVDALWLAAMGYDHLGAPLCAMPAAQRKALDVVSW